MADHIIPLRRAFVLGAKASLAVGAVVTDRIYGESRPAPPVWPFAAFDLPILIPDEGSGWEGGSYRVTGHVFSKAADATQCGRGTAALAETFDQKTLFLQGGGSTIELFHVGTQIIRDSDEADAFHGIVEFQVIVAEPSGL